MRWRRAIVPLAWTVAACVLLTAGWVAYKVTDPFAGQRQRAVQEQLFQQWRTAPQHASQAGAGGHRLRHGYRPGRDGHPGHGHPGGRAAAGPRRG